MTQEEKNILLKDICARLPYDVEAQVANNIVGESTPLIINKPLTFEDVNSFAGNGVVIDIKPYLRPMSSMTEEEKKEFQACHCVYELHPDFQPMMCNLANECNMFDWLISHHFDYRGLIPMGLAFEAPDDMYKVE